MILESTVIDKNITLAFYLISQIYNQWQGSGGGIKSITISVTKMDTLSGKINKQSVWVLTNTLDESTWKQGQFRIPELELDEYYVRPY